MRKRSVAVAAAAVAAAACTTVPATASAPVRDASATPMCATSQLSVAQSGGDAGAGNLYFNLVFTNHSRTVCHVTGYPGVSMLDARGKGIGAPATRSGAGYSPVTLKPGASASDAIHTVNHQGTCLPTSAQLRVYPPGNRASVMVPARITECYSTFEVNPLTAGKGGAAQPMTYGTPTAVATPTPTRVATSAPSPTPTATPSGVPTSLAPGSPTPIPVTPQVTSVPKGAPNTGVAESTSGGGNTAVVAGSAAGVLAVGALGAVAVRRRKSQTRG